jgi:hypothetical protein
MDDVEEDEADQAAAMSYLEKKFVKALSQALSPSKSHPLARQLSQVVTDMTPKKSSLPTSVSFLCSLDQRLVFCPLTHNLSPSAPSVPMSETRLDSLFGSRDHQPVPILTRTSIGRGGPRRLLLDGGLGRAWLGRTRPASIPHTISGVCCSSWV